MVTKTTINPALTWIHLTNPREADVRALKSYLNIHPIILDEIMGPSDRTRVEQHEDYLFLVYHIPIYNEIDRTSRRAEIDMIVGKELLITVVYEKLEPMATFEHRVAGTLASSLTSTAQLVYYLLEDVNEYSMRQLKHVEKKLNFVGHQLFQRQNSHLLEEISYIRRDLLEFSIVAVPQRSNLESLLEASSFWGPRYRVYFTDLMGDFLKVLYRLENLKGTIESYSDTLSQIFEFKTSEIVRRFSILGFLTFPLILYTSISLQPTVEGAIIKSPSDFWIQFGGVTALILLVAWIYRRKGWL